MIMKKGLIEAKKAWRKIREKSQVSSGKMEIRRLRRRKLLELEDKVLYETSLIEVILYQRQEKSEIEKCF